jgi:glucokinase
MEKYGYAVDIGGTAIKFGLFSEDGRLLEKREFLTDCSDGGRNILPDVAAAVRDSMSRLGIDEGDILGIGIDVPGPATEDGLVRKCVNLGWNAVIDVGGELEQLIKLPVFVGNDGDTAALGEMWQGSAKGCRNLVLITLGTGVGGGIVVDGKIVCGKNGAGGEIGHIPLNPDEPLACPCGNRGCLEQYASATGVVRKARELLAADMRASELRSFERLTAKDVWDCCAHGDALATSVIENFGDYLGRGAAAIACVDWHCWETTPAYTAECTARKQNDGKSLSKAKVMRHISEQYHSGIRFVECDFLMALCARRDVNPVGLSRCCTVLQLGPRCYILLSIV